MIHWLDFLRELTPLSIAFRLLLSVVIGGIIGLERSNQNRPAGLRTHILVCLGSALVMITAQYCGEYFGTGDITRMGAQVVSGIGFLGAGTIIFSSGKVKGLTTAAGLWATACMGLALGIGFYEGALVCALLVTVILVGLSRFSHKLQRSSTKVELAMLFDSPEKLNEVNAFFRDGGIVVTGVEFKSPELAGEYLSVQMSVELPRGTTKDAMVRALQALGGIYFPGA